VHSWRWAVVTIVVMFIASTLGCARKRATATPGLLVPNRQPRDFSVPQSGRRAQDPVDEVIHRLKHDATLSHPPSDTPRTVTQLGSEPERSTTTSGTLPTPPGTIVVVTERGPARLESGGASATESDRPEPQRDTGPLGSQAATLVAVALIAAIVALPRVRRRGTLARNSQR
jgi:hypothetical protein